MMSNYRLVGTLPVALVSVVLLASCATPQIVLDAMGKISNATEQRDAVVGPLNGNADVRGGRESADRLAATQKKPTVLKQATRSWVGSVMVPVNADDRLPATFSTDYVMKFADGKGPLPLAVIAARLSQIVQFRIKYLL